MDRSSETTDAFAEVRIRNEAFKTEVCRKSLNPTWPNSDWFRFDVDDCDLQDEPLQIRIMDYDIYSANDAIGKVYLMNQVYKNPSNFRTYFIRCTFHSYTWLRLTITEINRVCSPDGCPYLV